MQWRPPAATPSRRGERTATTQEPIVGGIADTTGLYPYVGEVQDSKGNGCSSTLITPLWVMTANHCITGQNDAGGVSSGMGQTADVTVTLALFDYTTATGSSDPHVFTHKYNSHRGRCRHAVA